MAFKLLSPRVSIWGPGFEKWRFNMVRLNKKLDATQTGQDAEKLYTDLHKRIVGQNEAIDHIVNIYQMYMA